MKVFVVNMGEDYEGSHVMGVFFTRRAAFTAVREYIAMHHYSFSYGTSPLTCGYSGKTYYYWHPWEYRRNWEWHSGCDYINIREWDVE